MKECKLAVSRAVVILDDLFPGWQEYVIPQVNFPVNIIELIGYKFYPDLVNGKLRVSLQILDQFEGTYPTDLKELALLPGMFTDEAIKLTWGHYFRQYAKRTVLC